MFRTWLMTSEPSTSSQSLDAERSSLLQEALSRAGVIRLQKQTITPTNIRNLKKSPNAEKISNHALMPIVSLLMKKCELAVSTFDRAAFETEDIKNLFKSLEQSGVQLSSKKDEVDEFMETAILALRTCLVEMERVFNLAESFKLKYLSILRRTVCHEALVGNTGDSDDELSDNPLMPVLGMPEVAMEFQNKAMQNALATLQGSLPIPMQFAPPQFSAAQLERNIEFLKQCGFPTPQLPPEFFKQFPQKSPEKSEEEKSQNRSGSPRSRESPSSPD